MKKILLFFGLLAAFCGGVNAQRDIIHRGEILQIYNGDTLRVQFTDDGVNFATNMPEIMVNGRPVPVGLVSDDSVTVEATTQDTVNFTALDDDYGYHEVFTVTYDTLDAADVTINFQQVDNADSTYIGVNNSVFPYTLPQKANGEIRFIDITALKYQRVIIDWGSATEADIKIKRHIQIRQ